MTLFNNNSNANYLNRTASFPQTSPLTVAGWGRQRATKTWHTWWCKRSNTASDDAYAGFMTNSLTLKYITNVSAGGTGVALTANTWHYIALVLSSTNAFTLYRINLDGTVASNSGTLTHVGTAPLAMSLLHDNYTNEFGNADIMGWGIWEAALTQEELVAQSRRLRPVRHANLWSYARLLTPADVTDITGQGRDWTTVGTNIEGVSGPVSWSPGPLWVPGQAAGGVSATANAGVATSTAAANAATATGGASVTAAVASQTTTAYAATATVSVTATAAVASSTATANAATATGGASVTAASATSTASANAATATGGASVTAAVAAATSTAYAATASTGGDASVTAGVATSTATANAATATGGASVTAARAALTTTAYAATATGGALATAAVAALTTTARAATGTGTATVTAGVASATATAYPALASIPQGAVAGALVTTAILSNGGARAIVMSTGGATPVQRRVG